MNIDWDKAPSWAIYCAVDCAGQIYWYEKNRLLKMECGMKAV
jgi:hypothetical protein